jgi:uncharacterized coiled-coil DUF342 family protein
LEHKAIANCGNSAHDKTDGEGEVTNEMREERLARHNELRCYSKELLSMSRELIAAARQLMRTWRDLVAESRQLIAVSSELRSKAQNCQGAITIGESSNNGQVGKLTT